MTEHSEVSHAMNADRPLDLITLREAAELLSPDPVGIPRLIQAGKLRVIHANRAVWVSRQAVIAYKLRAAGFIPAGEWTGPDPN